MYKIKPIRRIKKIIKISPDKSISHRALILSSLAQGKTKIKPFLRSDDTLATLDCMKKLGLKPKISKDGSVIIKGAGLYFPKKKKVRLWAKESGTTMRILSGALCGQRFPVSFAGSSSLKKRPMDRIIIPLTMMGAKIKGRKVGSKIYPPLKINPCPTLKGIKYLLPIPSAQVKSAILLASLYAQGRTQIIEPIPSRDHTERMFSLFKVKLKRKGRTIISAPIKKLISPEEIFVPADFSSASFFIVLGLILKNSKVTVRGVNLNPTRSGLLAVLKRMGAKLSLSKKVKIYEPYADITARSSSLKGVTVKEKEIPLMIDEIPILCVAASYASGLTRIKGLKELKVKETDRINSMVTNLRSAGIKICAHKYKKGKESDWMIEIKGAAASKKKLKFKSFSDHRTAMSMVIFGLANDCESSIEDIGCINKSFPQFLPLINCLRQ